MNYYTGKEIADILKSENDEEMTLRKVRYYTQIGMIPPLEMVNNKPKYTDVHLEHLRAIRTMKKTGKKLENIKATLNNMEMNDVSSIGKRLGYYSSEYLLNSVAQEVTNDISITFTDNISKEKQQEIIEAIKKMVE